MTGLSSPGFPCAACGEIRKQVTFCIDDLPGDGTYFTRQQLTKDAPRCAACVIQETPAAADFRAPTGWRRCRGTRHRAWDRIWCSGESFTGPDATVCTACHESAELQRANTGRKARLPKRKIKNVQKKVRHSWTGLVEEDVRTGLLVVRASHDKASHLPLGPQLPDWDAAATLARSSLDIPLALPPATEVPSSGDAGRVDDAEPDALICRLVEQLELPRQLSASLDILAQRTEVPFVGALGADINHCALSDYNFY